MQNYRLTLITITKDDPVGLGRTLVSAAALRSRPGVEQLVVYAPGTVPDIGDQSVVLLPQRSSGIAGAFNEGLNAARGEWIWFLNGGDAIHENLDPDWLFGLLHATQAEAVSGALHYDGAGLPTGAPVLRMQWPLVTSWLPHPATLVRRTVLLKLGGFDPRWKICMDYDLWCRLLTTEAKIDVIAVSFARFDVTGISNRAETRSLLMGENAAILWRHKAVIFRTCWQKTWRLLYIFWCAAKSRWS